MSTMVSELTDISTYRGANREYNPLYRGFLATEREGSPLYKVLFEKNSDVILIIDPVTGRIIDANKQAVSFYGYEREELCNMTVYNLNTLNNNEIKAKMDDVMDGKEKMFYFKHKISSGEIKHVEVETFTMKYEYKKYLCSTIKDMANYELDNDFLNTLTNNSSYAICKINDNNKIVDINHNFEKLFKYKKDEIIGKKLRDTIYLNNEEYNLQDQIAYINGKGLIKENIKRVDKYNNVIFVDLIVFPIYFNKKHMGAYVLYKDIRKQKEAEISNNLKNKLLINMSHEIRTPISGIIGMIDLAKNSNDEKERIESLTIAKKTTETLNDLLNSILNYSKLKSGNINIKEESFNLIKEVKETLDIFKIHLKKKNLTAKLDYTLDIPKEVIGDNLKIKEVLFNLISNAIKFTKEGFIKVSVKSEKIDLEKTKLIFSVKDTGIGIPREKQDIIFNSFKQIEYGYSKKQKGTGLGLTISKELVKLMGGEIWLDSQEGIGTTFYFQVVVKNSKKNSNISENKSTNNTNTDNVSSLNTKVLLVEDDFISQKLIKTYLTEKCMNISIVENGYRAIEKLRKEKFNLILMDVQMPMMDGIEVTREIRSMKTKGIKDIPIIGCTARGFEDEKEKYLNAGMDDYITKPIDFKKLMKKIEFWSNDF